MNSIILITHGNFASNLLETSKLFIGDVDGVQCLELSPEEDIKSFQSLVQSRIIEIKQDVLVLCDLKGGSPMIASIMAMESKAFDHHLSVVTGVNLPMLIEVLMNFKKVGLNELTNLAVQVGKAGIEEVGIKDEC